jgi:subtilisin family serine protease
MMHSRFAGALVALSTIVAFAGTATARAEPTTSVPVDVAPEVVPDQYIVTLEPTMTAAEVADAAAELAEHVDGEVVATWSTALTGFAVAGVAGNDDLGLLLEDARVERVAEDAVFHGATSPTLAPDPGRPLDLWNLDRIDQRDLPADLRYEHTAQGAGVDLYVLDTGIVPNHVGFGGRASVAFDAEPNGDDNEGIDCVGHGTHVAGTAGGGDGHGAAHDVQVLGVRVLDCTDTATASSILSGIEHVASNADGPTVANLSISANVLVPSVLDAVEGLAAQGVVPVVAAGNGQQTGPTTFESIDACTVTPAAAPSAITVSATDPNDARPEPANFGDCVDLFAPGIDVWSYGITSTSAFAQRSGTSMAAPLVAGAAAAYLGSHPNATVEQVRNALVGAATRGSVLAPGVDSPNRLLFFGSTFDDVSQAHPFWAEVEWMAETGITTGFGPGTYAPAAAVSRAAMSAFMYRLAGEPDVTIPPTTTFGDVSTSHPFFDEIEWMASEGITTGTAAAPKPLYKPADPVSRSAMSAFMYRLADEPAFVAPATATFGDVSVDHPLHLEVEWMASEGITTGTAATPKPLYKPTNPVSRAAMSAFMQRLAISPGIPDGATL